MNSHVNGRTKLGLDVLETALLMGVLGDELLRATPWGINVFVWTVALVAATARLLALARRSPGLWKENCWLLLPVVFFAAAFAWRDSPVLKLLNGLALLAALSLIAWRARGRSILLAGVGEYILALIVAGRDAAFGCFPLLLRDVNWKEAVRPGWSRRAIRIARGLAIAVPLLLVFGGLFMAADAVFEGLVRNAFHFDLNNLYLHAFFIVFFTWTIGGYLRGMLTGKEVAGKSGLLKWCTLTTDTLQDGDNVATEDIKSDPKRPAFSPPSLGIIEIGIALGSLDLLFLCFVAVQIRYLFGGAAWVESSVGLTYAEYARRGFFELVTVAALALFVLLVTHWLLLRSKNNSASKHLFRVLATIQIILLFVIMASAFVRMHLYQREYGLTELRLYTTAFMVWLGLVFLWFAATALRGRRERFAWGAMIAGFLIAGALQVANPDALIVRANAAHARAGRRFDAAYATSLSADAVPALVAVLPALNRHDRCIIASSVLTRWSGPGNMDWRAWSLSRTAAWRATRENETDLRALVCPQRDAVENRGPQPTKE